MRIKTRHSNWTPPSNPSGSHPSTGSRLVEELNVGRLGVQVITKPWLLWQSFSETMFVRLRTSLNLTQVLQTANEQPKNLKLRRFHSCRADNQAGVMVGERIISWNVLQILTYWRAQKTDASCMHFCTLQPVNNCIISYPLCNYENKAFL